MQYFVIASDGKEYGPATVDVLRQWVSENRLTPQHMLKDAATGETLPASQVPGLFPEPVAASPAMQPMPPVRPDVSVLPTAPQGPAAGSMYATPSQPAQGGPQQSAPQGTMYQPKMGGNWQSAPSYGGQPSKPYSDKKNLTTIFSALFSCALALVLFFVFKGLGLIIGGFALFRAIRAQTYGEDYAVIAIIMCVITMAIIGVGWMMRMSGAGI